MELSDADFASYFKAKTVMYHTRIEHAISDTLGRFSESKFYEPLNYSTHGGKRIRPLIVLLCYDAVNREKAIKNDPVQAAVGVELLHTESLIHDDIMDSDKIRRDRDAFHIRYGLDASLLSADFVLGIILDIAAQYSDPRVGRELSKAALRMSEGQYSEAQLQSIERSISPEEYIQTITQKTAALFQTSSRLGAIIADAKQQTLEAVSDFGLNLGIAYQMQDDLLDWDPTGFLEKSIKADTKDLRKRSFEYALSAKNSIALIPDSDAKERLWELAEFAVRRRF